MFHRQFDLFLMKYTKNILIGLLLILFLAGATLTTWVYSQIDGALPILDGKETLFGLSSTATVARDRQGIPTIQAKSRADIALATGFIHAQERFFQMDLLRRNAAGELSSLFGGAALAYDKSIRRHRFRERARKIVEQLPKEQLLLLKAYTRGVNQGLDYLKAPPFEYLLLQQDPVKWQEEDSILTVFSMYIDLQYHEGDRERTLGLIQSTLGAEVYAFLNPKGSIWDAALDNSHYPESKLPSMPWSWQPTKQSKINKPETTNSNTSTLVVNNRVQADQFPGSNNWAVAGALSKTGSAIIANDMHLGIRVPNTWFRASFEYQQRQNETDDITAVKVTGLTLPGTPNIIVGSNGHIAWGFTNSYGDWSDVIVLETNQDQSQYLTPEGYVPFGSHKEIIAIKGQGSVEFSVKETIWGPVIGENEQQQLLAYRWVAHDAEAVNFQQMNLELSHDVDEALLVAAGSGIPAQNFVVGDNNGNIGWTIMGPIPIKQGNVGDLPTSWSNGVNAWAGYLSPTEYPRIKNPTNNRLWTANARVVGADMLNKLGNGGYALGARAQQIRDNLMAKDSFEEQDLLTIALDDEAVFLQRWQQFLLNKVLLPSELTKNPWWSEAKNILTIDKLHASTDSVAYRLITNFRLAVRANVFKELIKNMDELQSGFSFTTIRHQLETPLWQIINQQPDNILPKEFENWTQLFAQSLNETLLEMTANQPLSHATWGQQNVASIRHPLSDAVPFIGHWLNMPYRPLAGDSYMPRVQGTSFGASERMVVSPGHEENGILHMPTSQAGHPWSPYYGMGHSDWELGKASPFLPGVSVYTLTLLSY